tara:strand:+ start:546 stop:962 length:417 start_codon:yes stop_codon:yes gene_type:complete
MEDEKLVPVLWLTLTDTRQKIANVVSQLDAYDDYLWKLCSHSKCHISTLSGYDAIECHCHHCVQVPESEVKRFWQKWTTFNASEHWKFKHMHLEPWDESRKNLSYIEEKHIPVQFSKCPKQSTRCRKGNCNHSPTQRS